ncbi:MAG: hypothetical protein M1290_03500 [Candidatus Thermoplasmatota archaeon]|nr:hypothetical protein [Candidatus Thermoplasmatota archaeon]MCL5789513.1 hypothetical protein [Candidatus Thermoplasmatota archaeon]
MNRRLLTAMIIILLSAVVVVSGQTYAQSSPSFPTISYQTYQGYNITITTTDWNTTVYPVIYSKNFSTYDWKSSPDKNYILFSYGLTGLNPYGAEFIVALSSTGNLTEKNVTIAFEKIAPLDATGTGYTNQEKLNAGALPGFSNSTPTSFNNPGVRSLYGYVFAGAVVVSIIALYFIFNRKKDE